MTVTTDERTGRIASELLLDAIVGTGEISAVLRRQARDLGSMRWGAEPLRGVHQADVDAIRRWLQDQWVDWLLLRVRGRSAELRFRAGRLLDDIESVDSLDLWGIARFIRALYVAEPSGEPYVLQHRYEALDAP